MLRQTSIAQRAEWMRAAAAILDDDAEGLGELITIEMGKPIAQSVAEVHKCAKAMRFYADNSEEFLADVQLDDPATVSASRAWTRYEPLGVILAVMPWNYPLWQVIRFAAPALMAGNTGLLKHASNVPQSALFLDTLFERAGFPRGSFRALLIGGAEVGAVIADPRVKAVTLTGSEPAGRSVAAIAGDHVKKAVLELGGSDPFIVLSSADVKSAAATAVRARINNNGQSCIAGKRFIVHADVYDDFAAEFTRLMAALEVGDPLDPATEVGPVATESGRDDLIELVEDARARGASILTGGSVPERPGWYYAPTVIADLPDDARLVQEETFGPGRVPVSGEGQRGRAPDREPDHVRALQCGLDARPRRGGVVRREPRRGRRLHQRDDGLVSGAPVRRHQAVRLRPGARCCRAARVLQPEDGVEGIA